MKVLSVCQPWAWAVVNGIKCVENREWQTSYRGPLAIHASKSTRYFEQDFSSVLPTLPHLEKLDFGAIVGIVHLDDCVRFEDLHTPLFSELPAFAEGPLCWMLSNAHLIDPFPCRGRPSLFDVPDRLIMERILCRVA